MSLYQVQKVFFNLYNDLDLRKNFRSNPNEILKGYDLTDSEVQTIIDLDMGSLYRMGVHTFLLWQFARIMGVKRDVYFSQIGRDNRETQ